MAALIPPQRRKRERARDPELESCNNTRTRQRLRRLQSANEIRQRIARGQTNKQIIKEMGLAERSFYRLLNKVYEDDLKRLEEQSTDNLLIELQALKDRLIGSYKRLLATASDEKIPLRDRLQAEATGCEVAVALFRVHVEGPLCLRQFSDQLQASAE